MSYIKQVIPQADMLMGSMRSMGYSFEAAIADIIDNSISALATTVKVLFPKSEEDALAVGILDNGCGMGEVELLEAMRYGSKSCEAKRDENDLGRFGLGLKSASLSQCRKLTVASYDKNGCIHAATWDYNYILEQKDWMVKMHSIEEINELPYIEALFKQKEGTLVVWQDFDFFEKGSNDTVYKQLDDIKSTSLQEHLELVYHRKLGTKLQILIDNYKLKPADPFLENHNKTTHIHPISIAYEVDNGEEFQITATPYILPYYTDLTTEDQKKMGGLENLRKNQGFYIYRNERLIIWGSWFGMHTGSKEITKYARVCVDFPNSLDDVWSIDIKKQTAVIPARIKNQLTRKVAEALNISRKKQNHRGRIENIDEEKDYIWSRNVGRNNHFFYTVNRENAVFQHIRESLGDQAYLLDTLVGEIEYNLPVQQIYLDRCNNILDEPDEDQERLIELRSLAINMIKAYSIVFTLEDSINKTLSTDSFSKVKDKMREELINYFKSDHD